METIDKNLTKLHKFLAFLDEDNLTRKEFTDTLQKVIDLVVKIEERMSSAIKQLQETYENLLNKMGDDYNGHIKDVKNKIDGKMERYDKERNAAMNNFYYKIDNEMEEIKKGIKETNKEIGLKIQSLEQNQITLEKYKEKELDIDEKLNGKINLFADELHKELEIKIQQIYMSGRNLIRGAKQTTIINETPSGALNGANTTFYLITMPKKNSLILLLNGVPQRPGTNKEYTLSGKTITMNIAPLSTDAIYAYYTKF